MMVLTSDIGCEVAVQKRAGLSSEMVPQAHARIIATDEVAASSATAVSNAVARFSVFLSNYNHGRYLPEALDAILEQSIQPHEIYLIDDGSTDGSPQIIDEYACRYANVRSIKLAYNRGFMANLEEFLATTDAEYIYMAAADDVVLPGLFEKSLAMLQRFPAAGLCSASSLLMSLDGKNLGRIATHEPARTPCFIPPEVANRLLMRRDGWFMGNTTIYRRSALRRIGDFDAPLAGFADGFACRVIAATCGACYIPDVLAYWRRSPEGMAGQMTRNAEVARAIADRASILVRERYASDFAPGYGERLHRRLLYQGAVAATQWADGSRAYLEQLLGPLRPVDRAALAFIKATPLGKQRLAMAYLALRLRPHDVVDRLAMALRGETPPGSRLK
ncbi:MAG: glycosyltransferase [Hyphomicrobium sp.]|uniref:glycosyltransferase family 2 protein n=1 Tax=Hyphomicrobium sp. TaxID=82 RepID=UPI0013238DCA|nr:glycosyltransferase family 2 protein [Hyphomicrobium sp.]KAB2939008.1 MAG: glycosyltransferase family 2 protein [Hyphomicrobium sp.]MBZ0211764.1 glycosyltransferase [Hyphomicrobium sp.]